LLPYHGQQSTADHFRPRPPGSNPSAELIFDGALPLVGGSRLSTCAPMSFDRSDNRIIGIHWPPVAEELLFPADNKTTLFAVGQLS